jgi:hypothetical protein
MIAKRIFCVVLGFAVGTLLLAPGCASWQSINGRAPTSDPTSEALARQYTESLAHTIRLRDSVLRSGAIGVFVERIDQDNDYSTIELSVKNNTGNFITSLFVYIYVYDNTTRVGDVIASFDNVSDGETMVKRKIVSTSGRSWDNWKFAYRIH